MPKTKLKESVLHDWVHELPFQMQALLLTAMRGPDQNAKHCPAKYIIRYLRGVVLKPAGDWGPHTGKNIVGLNNNNFMWGEYDYFRMWCLDFVNNHDEYPHHFLMHLIHCAEVVGYYHPIQRVRNLWYLLYADFCDSFHMRTETKEQLEKRLNDFGAGIHNKAINK